MMMSTVTSPMAASWVRVVCWDGRPAQYVRGLWGRHCAVAPPDSLTARGSWPSVVSGHGHSHASGMSMTAVRSATSAQHDRDSSNQSRPTGGMCRSLGLLRCNVRHHFVAPHCAAGATDKAALHADAIRAIDPMAISVMLDDLGTDRNAPLG